MIIGKNKADVVQMQMLYKWQYSIRTCMLIGRTVLSLSGVIYPYTPVNTLSVSLRVTPHVPIGINSSPHVSGPLGACPPASVCSVSTCSHVKHGGTCKVSQGCVSQYIMACPTLT